MSTASETKTASSSIPVDPALLSAWRRFINYDTTSMRLKRQRTRVRVWIILLGVITSSIAILITYRTTGTPTWLVDAAKISLAILPILTALLISYASEFSPILAWSVYRVGAEMLRREIYLYRMQAGDYGTLDNQTKRQALFCEHIHKATGLEKIYESDKLDLPILRDSADQVLRGTSTVPQIQQIGIDDQERILGLVKDPRNYLINRAADTFRDRRRVPVLSSLWYTVWRPRPTKQDKAVKKLTGDGSKAVPEDDGFSPLAPDQYVLLRLIPQLNWYSNRITWDFRYLRNWKVAILILGSLGSVLVALAAITSSRLEPLVAITTATAVAAGLYLELKMYNHTYLIYNNAARQLQDLLDEWMVALDNDQPGSSADLSIHRNFVVKTEQILQAEREEWMQRVIQSQTALEQKLAKTDSQFRTAEEEKVGLVGLARSLRELGELALRRGDFEEANTFYRNSLDKFQKAYQEDGMITCLEGFARIANAQVQFSTNGETQAERAAKLYGATKTLRESLNVPRAFEETEVYEQELEPTRKKLGDQKFKDLALEGGKMELESAIEFAQERQS